jgi:hypothetical protein
MGHRGVTSRSTAYDRSLIWIFSRATRSFGLIENPMNFNPDPKALMEMSQLIQQLPPAQLSRMQTLMHNMMAGFDVSKEMEEFEKSLPPGFREKLMSVMGPTASTPISSDAPPNEMPKDMSEARLTILRAIAEHQITPEQALQLLFPHGA